MESGSIWRSRSNSDRYGLSKIRYGQRSPDTMLDSTVVGSAAEGASAGWPTDSFALEPLDPGVKRSRRAAFLPESRSSSSAAVGVLRFSLFFAVVQFLGPVLRPLVPAL
jgi:hypothetical protein